MALVLLLLQGAPAHYRHRAGWTLPDSVVTPGAVRETVTAHICRTRTPAFRHTTGVTKQRVYQEYAVLAHHQGQYEIDHLIPLELGGKDTITNLWPETARPVPGFHEKDQVENAARRAMCTGQLSADSAQRWIVHDFPGMYRALLGSRP